MPVKKLVVDEAVYSEVSSPQCPNCGEPYLHQGVIEVYNRNEDANNVRCVVVDGSSVFSEELPNAQSNNPSDRRQGCIIHFECEHCTGIDFKLKIAQHKGYTLMSWEYDDGKNS